MLDREPVGPCALSVYFCFVSFDIIRNESQRRIRNQQTQTASLCNLTLVARTDSDKPFFVSAAPSHIFSEETKPKKKEKQTNERFEYKLVGAVPSITLTWRGAAHIVRHANYGLFV